MLLNCSLSIFMTLVFSVQKPSYDNPVGNEQLLTLPQRSLTTSEQALFSEFLRYAQNFLSATVFKIVLDVNCYCSCFILVRMHSHIPHFLSR